MLALMRWRAALAGLMTLMTMIATVLLVASSQPPPPGEFVPINQLPPSEQLPAAPLVIAAYAFVWIALLFYVWSVWRRLVRVEGELASLEHRLKK